MPAITVENLSKSYVVGHNTAQTERYTALRDVLARNARNLARKTRDMVHGRAIVQGDEVEEFWALKDVSFEVKRGETLGIIGRNGAGKSTLLKVLSRITEPTKGRITIRGRVASLLEVGTGFHPELTGRENMFLNGAILGMTRAEIRRRFDEIVAFAEVERFLDTPVKRYSSGMYVRLAFAVAAHLEPEILVVDEVLAVGDAQFQKKCLGKMGDVAKEGRTVLFVSHNMEAVTNLCQSAILLTQGRNQEKGEAKGAVYNYLSTLSLSSLTSNGQFCRERTKPEAAIIITRVMLVDGDAPGVRFDLSKEIRLRISYQVCKPVRGGFLGFQVKTVLGLPIFTSTNADVAGALGDNVVSGELDAVVHYGEADVKIPAYQLNVGAYELHVAAFAPGRGLLDLMADIFFDVYDSGSFASYPFTSARQGVVLLRMPWIIHKTKRID